MPQLSAIPASFSIDNEQVASARIALSMLEAGVIEETDDEPNASPNTLIKSAVKRLLDDPLTYPGLDLTFRIQQVSDSESYYLLVFIEGMPVIDFDEAAIRLDAIDPQLGPSILGYVYKLLDLTPAFTPAVAKDLIEWQYWQGFEDDRVLHEEAQQELEHQFDGREGAFTHEDVVLYAEENYLTSAKVNERLAPRYQNSGKLTLRACRTLCETHNLEKALPVIGALERLAKLGPALPDSDKEIYDLINGERPFGLMITLGGRGGLVHEVYDDYENMIMQSGMDFQPTFALAFDPDDLQTLSGLRDALVACSLILKETNALLLALEELSL